MQTIFKPIRIPSSFNAYVTAALLSFFAILVTALLLPHTQSGSRFLLFFMAVILSAWHGGFGPGLFATIILLPSIYLTYPTQAAFIIEAILQTITFLILGGLISWLSKSLITTREAIRFRAQVFSQVASPLVILDKNQRIVYWNKGAEQLFGYPSRRALGKNFYAIVKNESKKHPPTVRGQSWEGEERYINKQGQQIIVHVSASPLHDNNRRKMGTLLLIRDITAYKRSEDSYRFLADANEKLSRLLDEDAIFKKLASISVPYLADACLVDIKKSGAFVLTASVYKNISKTSFTADFHKEYLLNRKSPNNLEKIYNEGKSYLKQFSHRIPAKLKLSRFQGSQNTPIRAIISVPLSIRQKPIGVVTFVSTNRARTYDEHALELATNLVNRAAIAVDNAELYRQAQEAVQSRDDFLSLASHELKTPLTSLLLQLQIVIKRFTTEPLAKLSIEKVIHLLQKAEKESKKLAQLITNLLNISRITGGRLTLQLSEVNLGELIERVVGEFEEQAKEHDIVVKILKKTSITGQWDSLQLEQVIGNLLSNAIKYGSSRPVEIILEHDKDRNALLRVTDHGIGIEKPHIENIFKPFDRGATDPSFQGLGVGLFISKQIVVAHGGSISVQSTPGKGSEFLVRLPLSPA